jgi:endonuclease III
MTKPEPLHRFNEEMSVNFHATIGRICERYGGNAANIWNDKPPSAELVYRFLEFRGVGPKIATMAANLLVRHLKVPLRDYYSIDVSADVHVRRVLARLRLVAPDDSVERVVYRVRGLVPDFPGIIDSPAWQIGRSWCRPEKPNCAECYMHVVCPTAATPVNMVQLISVSSRSFSGAARNTASRQCSSSNPPRHTPGGFFVGAGDSRYC